MEMVCDGRGVFGFWGDIVYGFLGKILYLHNVVGEVVNYMGVIYGGAM